MAGTSSAGKSWGVEKSCFAMPTPWVVFPALTLSCQLSPSIATLRGLEEPKVICCPFSALLLSLFITLRKAQQSDSSSCCRVVCQHSEAWAGCKFKIRPSGLQNDSVFLLFSGPRDPCESLLISLPGLPHSHPDMFE